MLRTVGYLVETAPPKSSVLLLLEVVVVFILLGLLFTHTRLLALQYTVGVLSLNPVTTVLIGESIWLKG